jgi:DNA-binding NarL/FixJ family response regulator
MASKTSSGDPFVALSPQDREVLRFLGKGMDVAAIAGKVGVSTEILTHRCDEVRKKLGLQPCEELRSWALRHVASAGQLAISAVRVGQLLLPLGSTVAQTDPH